MGRLLDRLTYANVMATIAVFISLGGASYAAVNLPRNSVGSKQIRNGQVKAKDHAKSSVSSRTVKNRSLRATDFAPGQLPGVGGPGGGGVSGGPGTPGANGAPGRDGAALVHEYEMTQPYTTTPSFAEDVTGMSGGSWTQPAGSLDFFFPKLTFEKPSGCHLDSHQLSIRVVIDGIVGPTQQFSAAGTHAFALPRPHLWFSPSDQERTHTIKVQASSNCPNPLEMTITDLRVDVVRAVP